ncbi:MAG: hypothetical protein NTV88_05570 [Candidatus Micrarchaeota archaeon]|nr:hypothetical protein [Candidatus Micrarchaeota archaeon]
MDDFQFSVVVSALVVVFIMFTNAGVGVSIPFALALLALSMVGFFALASFKKAGIGATNAEYLFMGTVFGCYIVAAIALSAFSAILPYAFIPLVFCAPAVGMLVRGAITSG